MKTTLSFEDHGKTIIAEGYAVPFIGHINRQVTHGEVKATSSDVVVSFPDGSSSVMTREAFDFMRACIHEGGASTEVELTRDEKIAIGEIEEVAVEAEGDDPSTFGRAAAIKTILENGKSAEDLLKDTTDARPSRELKPNESFDVKTGKILDEFGLPVKE